MLLVFCLSHYFSKCRKSTILKGTFIVSNEDDKASEIDKFIKYIGAEPGKFV